MEQVVQPAARWSAVQYQVAVGFYQGVSYQLSKISMSTNTRKNAPNLPFLRNLQQPPGSLAQVMPKASEPGRERRALKSNIEKHEKPRFF